MLPCWEAAGNPQVFRLWSSGLWQFVVLYIHKYFGGALWLHLHGLYNLYIPHHKNLKKSILWERLCMLRLRLDTTCAEVKDKWRRMYRDTLQQLCMWMWGHARWSRIMWKKYSWLWSSLVSHQVTVTKYYVRYGHHFHYLNISMICK